MGMCAGGGGGGARRGGGEKKGGGTCSGQGRQTTSCKLE